MHSDYVKIVFTLSCLVHSWGVAPPPRLRSRQSLSSHRLRAPPRLSCAQSVVVLMLVLLLRRRATSRGQYISCSPHRLATRGTSFVLEHTTRYFIFNNTALKYLHVYCLCSV